MDKTAIQEALESLADLGVRVREWKVEVGEDSSGEPAVWVWVQLEDPEPDVGWETRDKLRKRVWDVVRQTIDGPTKPWVYVRVLHAEEPAR